jgi:electron transfer flavoprotein alpha subunit
LANVLVYIELSEEKPTTASLEALGEGRRLASTLGATLDAMVACDKLPEMPIGSESDDLIALLSAAGADRVIVLTAPQLRGSMLYATHGDAIAATCEEERPTMILFPATAGPRDVAPRLAARMGAAYVPEPAFEYGPHGELVLARTVFGGLFRRRLAVEDLEHPVVVTVSPGALREEQGDEEAEVVMLAAPPLEKPPIEELGSEPDQAAALELARVVVCAGAGVGPGGWELVCQLARALGGEAAATHEACLRGYAPPEREVGIGARRIAPRLYVACGASGSAAHLVALSGDTEIVAINSDERAPIFRVAQYGIVGDLHQVVPELLRALAPEAVAK